MGIIKAEHVCFEYEPGSKRVLNDIDLEIEEGQFVAVLGHNGCGKSTFMRRIGEAAEACHLNAILQPTSGRVEVAGLDTNVQTDEQLLQIRKNVGMVFQNPDNQIVATVVEEDVAFALENLGVPRPEMRRRIDDSLKKVGMSAFAKHATHQLSGGQKQRIAIAGVLAIQPKILVLDEPTAMLDPQGRREVMQVLHDLHRQGSTIVLITHFMDEAVQADRVIVMNDGEVLLDDTPHQVFQNAGLLRSIGLDVPQSTELMFLLRHKGFRVPLSVLTEQECVEVLEQILAGKIKAVQQ